MSGPDDTDDPPAPEARARDLVVDPATQAQLARWFGMPSTDGAFAARGLDVDGDDGDADATPLPDDETAAVDDAARAAALAAVEPALLARLWRHADAAPLTLMGRLPALPLVARDLSRLDPARMVRSDAIAEPREVEIPQQLRDDLRECTPQALLRDLERPVFDFAIEFERSLAEETPPDAGGLVRAAMQVSAQATFPTPATRELAAQAAATRATRAGHWAELPAQLQLASRRVSDGPEEAP